MSVQSIITAIADIKPGQVGQLRLILQHAMTPERKQLIEDKALLHSVRFVIIDGDKRLLFAVTFDGEPDAYLETFVAVDADGLDMIFGNCVGYPAGGSRDLPAFKQYIREHEFSADLSYTAYPDATVTEINRALRTRQKFEAFLDEFQ